MEQEQKMLINRNWKFMHGDFPEAKAPEYDDREWYDIGIPHSFGIPYFMEKQFYIGYGCYRKWLQIETGFDTKKLYLEFQASFQDTEVYVNGELAGTHRGGYTAFLIDITSFVRPGAYLIFVRAQRRRTCLQWRYLQGCEPHREGERARGMVRYAGDDAGGVRRKGAYRGGDGGGEYFFRAGRRQAGIHPSV